jgi:SWI/SNF-related matrix-associated actin-dependent regulator of chromatin subfamily A3
MEPQWNPTVEAQAIGRALRFGQEKQVTIIRYIMNNTVEEVREIGFTTGRVLSPTVHSNSATA